MTGSANTVSNDKIRAISLTAIFIALTFVFTFICVPGPRGGFIHLGNIPAFIAAILLGPKKGAIAGSVGMALYDISGGFFVWAPFTFVIRLAMGIVLGLITRKTQGASFVKNIIGTLVASVIMIAGYYVAEIIIYGNPFSPVASIPGNVAQLVIGIIGAIILVPILRKVFKNKIR